MAECNSSNTFSGARKKTGAAQGQPQGGYFIGTVGPDLLLLSGRNQVRLDRSRHCKDTIAKEAPQSVKK